MKAKKRKKIQYHRLTFILSIIGFFGSVAFYLGVLRQIYSPTLDTVKIEELTLENKELKETVFVLIEEIKCQE